MIQMSTLAETSFLPLTAEQASTKARFPVGCPVVHTKWDGSSSTQVRYGVVALVAVDLDSREFVYQLDDETECIFIPEGELGFGSQASVVLCKADDSTEDAVVIGSVHTATSGNSRVIEYTLQCLDCGSILKQIPHEKIRFRGSQYLGAPPSSSPIKTGAQNSPIKRIKQEEDNFNNYYVLRSYDDNPTPFYESNTVVAATPIASVSQTGTTLGSSSLSSSSTAAAATVRNDSYNEKLFEPFSQRITINDIELIIKRKSPAPRRIGKAKKDRMCVSYHVLGYCQENCPSAKDHVRHTTSQDQALHEWCSCHLSQKPLKRLRKKLKQQQSQPQPQIKKQTSSRKRQQQDDTRSRKRQRVSSFGAGIEAVEGKQQQYLQV